MSLALGGGFGYPGGFSPGGNAGPNPFVVDLQSYLSKYGLISMGHIDRSYATYPAVSYNLMSQSRNTVIQGPSGFVEAVYQFVVIGPQSLDVVVSADILRLALNGFRGMMGSTFVKNSNVTDSFTRYEPAVDESDVGMYSEFIVAKLCYGEV